MRMEKKRSRCVKRQRRANKNGEHTERQEEANNGCRYANSAS